MLWKVDRDAPQSTFHNTADVTILRPRARARTGRRILRARNDLQNQLLWNHQWNDQLKNYSKSPDIPLQLFNKFFIRWNQKERVDYLINQNRNSIIAHEVEPINWRNEQEEQSMRITGNARNAKNLKSISQINFKLITRALHPPLRRAGAL